MTINFHGAVLHVLCVRQPGKIAAGNNVYAHGREIVLVGLQGTERVHLHFALFALPIKGIPGVAVSRHGIGKRGRGNAMQAQDFIFIGLAAFAQIGIPDVDQYHRVFGKTQILVFDEVKLTVHQQGQGDGADGDDELHQQQDLADEMSRALASRPRSQRLDRRNARQVECRVQAGQQPDHEPDGQQSQQQKWIGRKVNGQFFPDHLVQRGQR